jgi:hypothetical protein
VLSLDFPHPAPKDNFRVVATGETFTLKPHDRQLGCGEDLAVAVSTRGDQDIVAFLSRKGIYPATKMLTCVKERSSCMNLIEV